MTLIAIVLLFQIESKKREAEAEKERQRLYDEKMMKKIEEDNKRIQQELEEEKRKAVEKQAKVEILMTFSMLFFIMWFPSYAPCPEDCADFHPPLHSFCWSSTVSFYDWGWVGRLSAHTPPSIKMAPGFISLQYLLLVLYNVQAYIKMLFRFTC